MEDLLTEQQFIQRFKEKGFELYKTEEIEKKVRYNDDEIKELNKYLIDINVIMWDSMMVKYKTFSRKEGVKIMEVLEEWASKH